MNVGLNICMLLIPVWIWHMPWCTLNFTYPLGFHCLTHLWLIVAEATSLESITTHVSDSDFSNVISKSDVKSLAEADEQEVVAEVQVNMLVLEHTLQSDPL